LAVKVFARRKHYLALLVKLIEKLGVRGLVDVSPEHWNHSLDVVPYFFKVLQAILYSLR